LRSVGGPERVGDLEVDHRVDAHHEVVLGDDRLGREHHHLLTQVDGRADPVDERDEQVQPGGEGPGVAAEAFHQPVLCLRDDSDRADEHDDQQEDGDPDRQGDVHGDSEG
jgi:hypothetical protein